MTKSFAFPLGAALLATGTAYLLQMCYMPYLLCSAIGAAWLLAVHLYVRALYRARIPAALLLLAFGAVQVDALGNLFRLYGRALGPVSYDEFAHMSVQALVAPVVVWLLREALARRGHRLPLGLLTFFAASALFALTAFYEIIELWDERYFRGQRIWSTHDAPNDLQWNFFGLLAGALATYFLMRRAPQPDAAPGMRRVRSAT